MTDETEITCKNCGSPAVSKYGSYKGVQRYCGYKYLAGTNLGNQIKQALAKAEGK